MRFFKIAFEIYSAYPLSEALMILRNYFRIIIRNRLPFIHHNQERIMGYAVEFPDRPMFFGMLTEIYFRRFYKLPDTDIRTIIDVGANIGLATLYFKWLHPRASVLCFEPNPEVLGFLEKNISRNKLANVKVFPVALGKLNGEQELFTSAEVKGSTSASTIPPINKERSFRVPVRRLSDFIEKPVDFIKIDVEGAEGQILEDLEETGKLTLIRDMIIEYHMHDQNRGYSMARLLALLEKNSFEYLCFPLFSDINWKPPKRMRQYLIYASRGSA